MALSGRALPGSRPTTLREDFSAIVLFKSSESVASSCTGLKPRLLAAARSLSRSIPASANSAFAASALIQPCAGRRGAGSLLAGWSYWVPDQEPRTTSQPEEIGRASGREGGLKDV